MLIRIFLENAHYKQFYYLVLNFFFIIIQKKRSITFIPACTLTSPVRDREVSFQGKVIYKDTQKTLRTNFNPNRWGFIVDNRTKQQNWSIFCLVIEGLRGKVDSHFIQFAYLCSTKIIRVAGYDLIVTVLPSTGSPLRVVSSNTSPLLSRNRLDDNFR